MDNNNLFYSLITGNSPTDADDFSGAVAARFLLIKDGEAFAERDASHPDSMGMGFCYDGNRCEADNLGWRTRQTVGFELSPEQIAAGEYDESIVIGFHEAASSEHWYRYEKDWG